MGKQKPNDYQRLASIIQKVFQPVGARITLGAGITVHAAEGERDVDVLVEYGPESALTRIAIEAKHWRRAVGIETVEQYRTKYDPVTGIRVDKVIIVGQSFSAPAKSLAKRLGIELHTLRTLESLNPSEFTRTPDSDLKLWLSHNPGEVRPSKMVTLSLGRSPVDLIKGPLGNGVLFSRSSPKTYGSPAMLARKILDGHLGHDVSSVYGSHEGVLLHVMAELPLPNMVYRRRGHRDQAVKFLFFDFGTHMLFPDLPVTQDVTYETPEEALRQLMRAKPRDKASTISITREVNSKSILLDGVREPAKEVIINLSFKEEMALLK